VLPEAAPLAEVLLVVWFGRRRPVALVADLGGELASFASGGSVGEDGPRDGEGVEEPDVAAVAVVPVGADE
jgi:hypothetical protein